MRKSVTAVEPFASRRRRLLEQFPMELCIVRGNAADGANPHLWYLTGIAEPDATLVLAADPIRIGRGWRHPGPDYLRGREVRQLLFLPESSPFAEVWGEGATATAGSIEPQALGVDAILPAGLLAETLSPVLARTERVGLVRGHRARLDGPDDPDTLFARTLRERFIGLEPFDATHAVSEMRRVKESEEIAAMRRAVAATAEGLRRVFARIAPGVREAELEGELTRAYREAGGGHAFDPIVAAGANAVKLHYTANDGTLAAGDLVLIDTGAQIDGYCADVSRTYPVDGEFTARQRELYDRVHATLVDATAACVSGADLGSVHAGAWETLDSERFVHGIGHYLGAETHDVGDVEAPFEPGVVVTVEPGLYLRDEGIGIRLEDDVLVGAAGPERLTEAIPVAADAVER